MADKLPRGSLSAATQAVTQAAADYGHDGLIAGDAETLARAAIEAALPLIERDVRRKTARHVLALDDYARRQDAYTRNKGPFIDMRTSLRKLARGEELADVKAVREQLSEPASPPGA